MRERAYAKGDDVHDMVFPEPALRGVWQGVRKGKAIEGYRAVVDKTTDRTYTIVMDGYELLDHRAVLSCHDEIINGFPEWGNATREVWMSNFGGRCRIRDTFKEIDFEIRPGDVVNPTLESYASYDTSWAQRTLVGGFRVVCTNGMTVGKILAEYKRKHTASLDLETAKLIVSAGMQNYTDVTELWKQLASRKAFIEEVNAFEIIGFNKSERTSIEREIKDKGTVKQWDADDIEKREVDIGAWDLYNIYTAEASHRVEDITRRAKITDKVTSTFAVVH